MKTPHRLAHKGQNQNVQSHILTGIISTTRKGAGYIDDPDPKKDSIYIEEGTLNTALNGDTVEFTVSEKNIRGVKMKVGTIKRIVNRAKETFVGIVSYEGNRCILIPDDKKMYTNISVSSDEAKRQEKAGKALRKDDKIFVRILPWTDPKKLPEGKVIKVLGKKGVNNVEMESIVLERGSKWDFRRPWRKKPNRLALQAVSLERK